MNIFSTYLTKFINSLNAISKNGDIELPKELNGLTVELPPKKLDADISSNAALILSKINNKKPSDLADFLLKKFQNDFKEFDQIFITKPGFLNFKFSESFWENFLFKAIKEKEKFGSNIEKRKKYNVEFVSANPTGPLHVGHCRGAILGDVISNVLKFNGNEVVREYYVNDYGTQVDNFTKSVFFRIKEILNNETFPENQKDLYPGHYVVDIARNILHQKKIKDFKNLEKIFENLKKISIEESIKLIKKNLELLGIKHDLFVYESKLVEEKRVEKTIEKLKKKKFVYSGKIEAPESEKNNNYKPREQLLFKSTLFDDDKDRVIQKNDLTWTYFSGDLAYHDFKIERKFSELINILGADHAGYTKRITAGVSALSNREKKLTCKVSQLVKLIKDGKPFKMSKRKGDYITVEDLIAEVGKDAARFIMLSRNNDVELEFNFEKVKEKSKENPLYYVQYCHARICSVFRNLNIKTDSKIKIKDKIFKLDKYEREIIKKISEWPKCLNVSANKLEPHRIPIYLYELSTLFHSYWNLGKEDKSYRFIIEDKPNGAKKMNLLKLISIVIKSGLDLVGVKAPTKM